VGVVLRQATTEDARAAARLLIETFPHLPVTARQVRWRLSEPFPNEAARHVAAMDGDKLVGWCRSRLDIQLAEPGHAHLTLAVHPGYRNVGIGTALLADAERHLAGAGAVVLHSATLEDEPTRHFCSRRGWLPSRWSRFLSLDLTPLATLDPPIPPDGVAVTPAWMLDDLRPLHDAYTECLLDEPREYRPPPLPYERWLGEIWRAPGLDQGAGTVVLVNGHVVSYALFDLDRTSGRIWSVATGTRRGWRGRGLAALAKAAALHRAAERGLRTAWTASEADNPQMTAVNERLGYRLAVTQVSLVRHLPRPGSTGAIPLP
jgi:GNAT superfamily N-acetyltransferase